MQVATPNPTLSSSTSTPSSISTGAPADATMTQLILDHPLYPLLQMVFQKCELATSSPRDAQTEPICSSDSFSEDIRSFINESRLRNVPITTGCHDVDKFMLKSIEVLRIHLLELEKVHLLCDNFCQRYINCLKGKLPIDLVVDDGSSRDTNSASRNGQQDGGPSSNNSTSNNQNQNNSSASSHNTSNNNTSPNGQHQTNNGHQQQHHHQSQNHHHNTSNHHPHQHPHEPSANGYGEAAAAAVAAYHQSYGAYGASGYGAGAGAGQNPYAAHHAAYAAGSGMGHYPASEHQSSHTKHEASSNNSSHHRELTASSGSSSASSVKHEHGGSMKPDHGNTNGGGHYETNSATTAPDRQKLHDDVRSPTGSTGSFLGDASMGSGDGTECEEDDSRARRQQKKRGIFPKSATNVMRNWLFQHLNHPYPSEEQKKALADETQLTILQVNNWFINARRRIVQPMIDQSNRHGMNGAPGYSPDAASMGYMLGAAGAANPQDFRSSLGGAAEAAAMNPLAASHAAAAMSSAMGAYSAASAQHLSQYGRQQQQSHAAMLGLAAPPTGPHMMGAGHPPHDYY